MNDFRSIGVSESRTRFQVMQCGLKVGPQGLFQKLCSIIRPLAFLMHPQNALSEALYNMKRDNPIWETSVQVMLDYANTAGRFSVGPDILEGLGWLAAQAGYFATPALICRQWGVYVWCVGLALCSSGVSALVWPGTRNF